MLITAAVEIGLPFCPPPWSKQKAQTREIFCHLPDRLLCNFLTTVTLVLPKKQTNLYSTLLLKQPWKGINDICSSYYYSA
jgi:hypothetical protein